MALSLACCQCVLLGGQRSCLSCTTVVIYLCQVWGCLAHAAYRTTSFEAQELEGFAMLSCYYWGMYAKTTGGCMLLLGDVCKESTGIGRLAYTLAGLHTHGLSEKECLCVLICSYMFLECVRHHSSSACWHCMSCSICVCCCSSAWAAHVGCPLWVECYICQVGGLITGWTVEFG